MQKGVVTMPKTHEQKIGEIQEWLGPGSLNFFGPPLGGKDTHGERFASYFGVPLLGGGDILRKNPAVPAPVRAQMDRGELVSSADYRAIVVPFLGRAVLPTQPLVLSAVGRLPEEQAAVIEATDRGGHPIRAVPYLQVSDAEVRRRIEQASRGRADDTPEALKTRLEEFYTGTMPVIDRYEEMDLLVPVPGEGSVEEVHNNLIHALYVLATA